MVKRALRAKPVLPVPRVNLVPKVQLVR